MSVPTEEQWNTLMQKIEALVSHHKRMERQINDLEAYTWGFGRDRPSMRMLLEDLHARIDSSDDRMFGELAQRTDEMEHRTRSLIEEVREELGFARSERSSFRWVSKIPFIRYFSGFKKKSD